LTEAERADLESASGFSWRAPKRCTCWRANPHWNEIERQVQPRAGGRCEYCRSLQGATFHVEHIIPRARGCRSHLNNLADAGPVAQFLLAHEDATRDDVLDFIEATWNEAVGRVTPTSRATWAIFQLA
jgi:hypothetical protein